MGNGATNITTTSATLNSMVNPNSALSEIIFEYGTSTDLDSIVTAAQSPLLADQTTPVNADIVNLFPGSKYFYRVKTSNEKGLLEPSFFRKSSVICSSS